MTMIIGLLKCSCYAKVLEGTQVPKKVVVKLKPIFSKESFDLPSFIALLRSTHDQKMTLP